jgi:arylsulfatase A-like enzyme
MTPPNILLILMDDMGWRDLACTGSPFYETPHLDRLCADAVRFTQAYAACPVCSPTRAAILTGKYPARLGLTDWIGGESRGRVISAPYIRHLPLAEFNLAHALRAGGYATWHVGKWHLGEAPFWPEQQGFEINIAGNQRGAPYKGYFAPWSLENLPDGPDGEYLTDRLTDEAIRLLRQREVARPFFLNLWHYAVHTPIQAPAELVEKYRAKAHALGLDALPTFEEGGAFPCEHKRDQRIRRRLLQSDPTYAALIENLDTNIGRLLAALDELGLADNTVVIFTSDNGGLATSEGSPTCNAPLAEGKGWMYEGGTREPLFVRWPGVTRAGAVCEAPVTSTDLYPTILEMAGLPPRPRQHVDGVSLAPVLRDPAAALGREAIYWHYPHYGNQGGTPGSSVRAGDWKLIVFLEDDHAELYNLRDDEGETRDLVCAEPARVAHLRGLLAAWRQAVAANMPTPNPDYAPWPGREPSGHSAR